ncbi:MFS transporter, partial [Chloroflexota bacterium]
MAGHEVRQSPGSKPGFFYGYIVVMAGTFIMMVSYGVYNAFGIFFKPVMTDFGWTRAMTSGAFSVSWIIHGLLNVILGGLTDKLGPRIVLTFCGFFLGLGYLLMSQINSVWQLYLFQGLIIGTGISGLNVSLLSTVARWFVARRSLMGGIVIAGGGVGALIMPPIANWLISTYDWRVSYIILGSLALVLVLCTAQFVRRAPANVKHPPYGESGIVEQEVELATRGFSLREALYTRQLWLVLTMEFSLGFCAYTVMVHIVPHATDLGISAASAANILATVSGLAIVGRIMAGGAGDKIGNRQVFIMGFILISAALFCMVPAREPWMLFLFAAIIGFAWSTGVLGSPLVADLFGLKSHGLILGVINSGYSIGAAIG